MSDIQLSHAQVLEELAKASGEELARLQSAVLHAPTLDSGAKMALMGLVAQELELRSREGLDRKAARLWKRHGNSAIAKGALIGLGVLLGVNLS